MNAGDLKQIDELLTKRLDEKLKNFPTKDDLKRELKVLQDNLEGYIADVFSSTDSTKADKQEVEIIKKKVRALEEKVYSN